MDYGLAVAGVVLLSGLFALLSGKPVIKKKSALRMPGYSLVYSDARGNEGKSVMSSKLLKSLKYDITGKPDYIYKKIGFNRFIPVEIKSGMIKSGYMPHKGDLLQLGAYFLIIEEVYGSRPKKGYIIYRDYMFIIKNRAAIRREVRNTLNEMRKMLKDGKSEANASFPNCRYCICKGTVCDKCVM